MYTMYDDVNLSLIPREPHAIIAYINGDEPTLEQARKDFPHARILEMSVRGIVPAQAYDIERFDYTPDDVPELYKVAQEAGIWRPCFYGQLSGTMPAIRAKLNTVITARADVRLLVASWDGVPIVPAGYDGKQFTDRALGRSLDESLLLDTFFQAAKPKPAPDRTARATVAFDPDGGNWSIMPTSAGSTGA